MFKFISYFLSKLFPYRRTPLFDLSLALHMRDAAHSGGFADSPSCGRRGHLE